MPDLPTGTVTFLFTDIEGSTTRWEQHREAMQAALARHDAILRQAIEGHGGVVFKTVGDAFYATFPAALDALQAALAAQRALQTEVWDDALGQVRVRMALHTGTAEARGGDYFGPPFNRVARLLSAGNGGQVLLSAVTQELVRDQLPVGVELRDLGEHRLKDLIRPERIFQLVAPDLEVDNLPLRTLASHPNNLPLQPTPLVGREREVGAVRQRLMQPEVRLLTLTGADGTGKTRLALQVAAELLESFQDGVWFVNLAPISDPNLVISAIATTLGVREARGQPVLETVQAYLHDKQLLLLLDNFEHVLPAAGVVAALLREAAHLKVLVTSRAPLHLQGEREYPVPPLEVPDPRRLPPLERLQQYEAIKLFIQAAQAVRPDFQVTNANAPAVAEICARLDGLPLAIELAAARSKLLPPEALLGRLQSRLQLLTSGACDLAARHQTLRRTIDWSYELLPAHEQRLFAQLAVFVGGWSIEAATAVCAVDDELPVEMLDALQSLLDKSLITPAEADGEPRFTMLETIREYALEQLHGGERVDDVRRRHAHYFHHLAQRAAAEWRGPRQLDWHRRLREEHANLLAALEWSSDHELATCAGLTAALPQWWLVSGRSAEGRHWLHVVLDARASLPPQLRAHVLLGAGLLDWDPYVVDEARDRYAESLALAREAGDALATARALLGLADTQVGGDVKQARQLVEESLALQASGTLPSVHADTLRLLARLEDAANDLGAAEATLEQSLAISRQAGDAWGTAETLDVLALLAYRGGDRARSVALHTESRAIRETMGDRARIARSLLQLSWEARSSGNREHVLAPAEEALAIRRELGDQVEIASALSALGNRHNSMGNHAAAKSYYEQSLALFQHLGLKRPRSIVLNNLGFLVGDEGDYARARSLLEESLAIVEETAGPGSMNSTLMLDSLARSALIAGEYAQARAWFGEVLTLSQAHENLQAIEEALEGLGTVVAATRRHAQHTLRAARLWGAAEGLATARKSTLTAMMGPNGRRLYEQLVGAVQAELGDEVFAAARAEGHAMGLDEVIAYALEDAP